MTPFGEKMRALRAERGVTMAQMAQALGVSSAYLSALEHGRRSRPSWAFVQAVIGYFNVIWDEADELHRLADLSRPKAVIETAGLEPEAVLLANRLARDFARLDAADRAAIADLLDAAATARAERP